MPIPASLLPNSLHPITRYAFAVGLVALSTFARNALDPILEDRLPFTLYFPSVLLSAWIGGFGPSILASVLGIVAALVFFVEPRNTAMIPIHEDLVALALYLLVSFAISIFARTLQKSEERAHSQADEIRRINQELELRVSELQNALQSVKQLQGLLPICAWCKKIRNDQNYWVEVESYLSQHSDAQFTHGMCPDCFEKSMNELGSHS